MNAIQTRIGFVSYEEYGVGLPLVLLHANPGDHQDFESIIPVLSQHYHVFALDWPGYGQSLSPQPPQSASAMLLADVLEDVLENLKVEQAILLGNSVGGYAAARFSMTHPERVYALILVSPGGFTSQTLVTRLFCRFKGSEVVTRIIATQFAKFYLKRRNPVVARILARTQEERSNHSQIAVDAAIWRSFLLPDYDLRHRASAIVAPTLLIFGKHDPVIRAKTDGQTAAASIPHAQLVVMDTGHEPFAEDPESFLHEVTLFLQSF